VVVGVACDIIARYIFERRKMFLKDINGQKMRLCCLLVLLYVASDVSCGEIAFTFDDAPTTDSSVMSGVERTELIIKALKNNGIPDALFFVTTGNIDVKGKERLTRYVESGFHLGNHSHKYGSANKMVVNEFMMDVYQAHLTLKNYGNILPYFRFPYLHYGSTQDSVKSIQGLLSELGYSNGYVTIDNFDWYINSALVKAKKSGKVIDYDTLGDLYVSIIWQGIEFYDGIAKRVLGRSPRHVLLLHENDTSALFLPKLAKHIRDKGWNFVSPQQAYEDPISGQFPNVLFHKQGRVAMLAYAKGIAIKDLRHVSESQEYLDTLLKNSMVFK